MRGLRDRTASQPRGQHRLHLLYDPRHAFQFGLRASGPATVGIYDVAGRRVRTLLRGQQPAGARIVTWDGRDEAGVRLAPGAYIVRLEAGGIREARTIRLVR